MPVSILFTIPNFITAGSGRAMMNIVERLDRARFRPAVCVSRKGGELDGLVERLGIPFLEADFTVAAGPMQTAPFGFDLWHSFHYLGDFTEPLIARMAGAGGWVYTKKNMGWRKSWYVRTLLADRVAAQNSYIREHFFRPVTLHHRSRLIPPSVDASWYSPDTPPRLGLRNALSIAAGSTVVSCVAQLIRAKGHPTLLRAVAYAPGVRLLLAGKPLDVQYTESLRTLATDLGIVERVHFLGGVSDIPALLAESDVFVLPSEREACPVALLEAMSCGVPCIVSDIPGTRDVIEDGATGLFFRTGDHNGMAAALRRIANNKEQFAEMARAARKRILHNYTIDREVRQYEQMYSEVLN